MAAIPTILVTAYPDDDVRARALNDGLRRPVAPALLLKALVLCVVCGALDELWQLFTPDRLSDVRDVMNDAIGAGIGLVALYVGRRLLARAPLP